MRLRLSSGHKKYLANTTWLVLEKSFALVASLAVGIYVARYLKPERLGYLSYAQSFVALFGPLAALGLPGIVVRNLVRTPERRNELLGTALLLKALGALAGIVILLSIAFTIDHDPNTVVLVSVLCVGLLVQACDPVDYYFQASVQAQPAALARTMGVACWSVLTLLCIFLHAPLVYFAAAMLLRDAISAAGLVLAFLRRKLPILSWRFRRSLAADLLRDSWPLILSGVMITIYLRISQIMLKSMLGATAVGWFAAAERLSTAWYFIPTVITASLFPAIVNARQQSRELYQRRLQMLFDLMVWMAIAVALPLTFFSEPLVRLLFGAEYAPAGPVLALHAWAGVFMGMELTASKWLITENYTKLALAKAAAGAAVNVLLNATLIPRLGVLGAALSLVLSLAFSSHLIYVLTGATRHVYLMQLKSLWPFGRLVQLLCSRRDGLNVGLQEVHQ